MNLTDYTYSFVSINPSGTHVAAVATSSATAIAANYWISIFKTSDGALVKLATAIFDSNIMAIENKNVFMDS